MLATHALRGMPADGAIIDRKVLLSSVPTPIVFPPVNIEGHLFVNGATRSNVVVVGMGGTAQPKPPLSGSDNI